jgi:hypothetical protein
MFLQIIDYTDYYSFYNFHKKIVKFTHPIIRKTISKGKIEKKNIIEEYRTAIILDYCMTTYTKAFIAERFITKSIIEFEKFVFRKHPYRRIRYGSLEIGNALILEIEPSKIQIKIKAF